MTSAERTAQEWFHEAARCYIDKHQGCAWCGGAHRVYRRKEGPRVTYSCRDCDFQAGQDEATGRCFVIPGERAADALVPDTMFDL
jgi:hypothetical protein